MENVIEVKELSKKYKDFEFRKWREKARRFC